MGTVKNGQVLIKANDEKDFYEVKDENEIRDTSSFIRNSEGLFIEYPSKYMKVTSEGISFSYNIEISQQKYLEEKKSAKIRNSIDSLMFELENETKKKRESSGERPPSSTKKKKKQLDSKKGKKRKKVVDDDSTPPPSGKKSKVKGKKGKGALAAKKKAPAPSPSPPPDESKTSKVLGALGSSIGLSAAGMSKLYSMAGYAADPESGDTKKTTPKGRAPIKSKKEIM